MSKKDLEIDVVIWSNDIDLATTWGPIAGFRRLLMVVSTFGWHYRLSILRYICVLRFIIDILYGNDVYNVMV
jgi:hypothetical protein